MKLLNLGEIGAGRVRVWAPWVVTAQIIPLLASIATSTVLRFSEWSWAIVGDSEAGGATDSLVLFALRCFPSPQGRHQVEPRRSHGCGMSAVGRQCPLSLSPRQCRGFGWGKAGLSEKVMKEDQGFNEKSPLFMFSFYFFSFFIIVMFILNQYILMMFILKQHKQT